MHGNLRGFALSALGCGLLIAALAVNEWTLPWILGHEKPGLELRSALAIRAVQAAAIASGVLILGRRSVWQVCRGFDPKVLVALAPILVLDSMFWMLGCVQDDITLGTVMAPLALGQKLIVDSLHILVLGFVLSRLTRMRAAWIVVAIAWGVAVMTDMLIYWFGRTRFEASYLSLVSPESVGAYFGLWPLLVTLGVLGFCAWSGARLGRLYERAGWRSIGAMAALALLLSWIDLPARYRDATHPLRTPLATVDADALLDRFAYLDQNSLLHVVEEVARPPRQAQQIEDLGPYEDLIQRYRLGLGRPPAQQLEVAPFRRVVFLMSESLSASFSGLLNPELPSTLTPFLDSQMAQRYALNRHRTVAFPTIPGISVTFLSHPNPEIVRGAQRPPSFVDVLAESGWRTVFMRAASRHFGGANIVLRDLGFQEQYGREHFEDAPETEGYVSGWGACDRVILEEAAALLDEGRDRPTFISLLTCDTHSPEGRGDYADLEYPDPPEWIHEYGSLAPYLRSIFRADHDVRLFVEDLEKRGLFDDETLVVVTADHMCPVSVDLARLPGVRRAPYGRIPCILLTPRALPAFNRERRTSQLDVGPTLLHLLGLDVPAGMWGRSLFDGLDAGGTFIGTTRGRIAVWTRTQRRSINVEKPAEGDDAQLVELFLGWNGE